MKLLRNDHQKTFHIPIIAILKIYNLLVEFDAIGNLHRKCSETTTGMRADQVSVRVVDSFIIWLTALTLCSETALERPVE